MTIAPDPASQPTGIHQLTTLTARQRELLTVLVDKNQALGIMFVGAIMARSADNNPEYLQQASHSLRELIDKLPHHFADAPFKTSDKLGNKVKSLVDKWNREPRAKNKSDECVTPKFVRYLEEFFAWQADSFPAFREVARLTVTRFDSSGRPLPQSIEKRHAEEWISIRNFFVRSAHHTPCSSVEFDGWYNAFEAFMLNRLRPRTFERADELDALIREGES